MESSGTTGFPLWQKIAFAFGGLAALAFIGYLVDKPGLCCYCSLVLSLYIFFFVRNFFCSPPTASEDESPKKRSGKRPPVPQQFDGAPEDVMPSFAQQHATSNGAPLRI